MRKCACSWLLWRVERIDDECNGKLTDFGEIVSAPVIIEARKH